MTIEAKVIADSIGPKSPRITTLQLRYPRFIHSEFMTHRVFSRNASSSRAIPVETQIKMIREDTAMPSHWGKNQSGMQAEEEENISPVRMNTFMRETAESIEFDPDYKRREMYLTREHAWLEARDRAIEIAEGFVKAGYHKQIVNRILEPFSHISVVVTATDFDNFFWLRRHKDAQPEIKILADAMYAAMEQSTPRQLNYGEWHLPYITDEELNGVEFVDLGNGNVGETPFFTPNELIMMSVARCARVSYLTHDGVKPDYKKDIALYERLVGSSPLHASPAEHQATPDHVVKSAHVLMWQSGHLHGNLTGYKQYRKMLAGENMSQWGGLNDFSA